jgi:hypothetical protein
MFLINFNLRKPDSSAIAGFLWQLTECTTSGNSVPSCISLCFVPSAHRVHAAWTDTSVSLLASLRHFASFFSAICQNKPSNGGGSAGLEALPEPAAAAAAARGAMPTSAMRSLQRDIAASELHLSHIRACAKAARQRTRRASARGVARLASLQVRALAVVATSLVRDEAVLLLAVRMLWRQAIAAGGVTYAELAEHVRAAAADVAAQARVRATAATAAGGRMRRKVALAVAEARTALWLLQANTSGAAVPVAHLAAQLRAFWPAAAFCWRTSVYLQRLRLWPRRRTAWGKAFRRRWGVGWRRLPARATMSGDELLMRVLQRQKWKPL